jgi:hypothetical protein
VVPIFFFHVQKPPTYAEKRRKWKRRLKARARDRARKLNASRAP